MIWLLTNAWWLVVIGVGLLALLHPAGWALIRAVPRTWWLVLAGAAVLGITFQAGRWYERSVAEERQEAREDKADVKGAKVAGAATEKAETATKTTRKESSDAQAEARVIVRSLPAACPGQPPRLRELGESAVEAARRSLPAAADG